MEKDIKISYKAFDDSDSALIREASRVLVRGVEGVKDAIYTMGTPVVANDTEGENTGNDYWDDYWDEDDIDRSGYHHIKWPICLTWKYGHPNDLYIRVVRNHGTVYVWRFMVTW